MFKIKTGLFIAILSLIAGSQAIAQAKNGADYFSSKDSVTITGKVTGYTPGAGDDFINFQTYSLTGDGSNHAVQLGVDGSFRFTFYRPYAGDINVNYKSAFESVYVEPAANINLNIFNDKLDDNNKNAFEATGKLAAINNLMFDFHSALLHYQYHVKADLGDKTQPDSVFAQQRSAQLSEELSLLETFLKDKHVNNNAFKKWQANQLSYSAAKDILLFPFFGKLNETINEPLLLGFIRRFPFDNTEALANSAYLAFLKMLTTDEQIIININPAYNATRKANGYNSTPLYLDKIDNLATGITRQVMYYDLYNSLFKHDDANKVMARFELTVTNAYIKKLLDINVKAVAEGFKLYDVTNRLKSMKVSDSLKQKFISLFEHWKGTNLLIDFWGDWCGPCMMEMPGYSKLIAAFENKPMKFIFFSAYMNEESMLAVKDQYHIKADFINLSKDEIAIMNNLFEFHSYPTHILVNASGSVVSNGTKSEDGIKKLLFE